MRAFSSPIVPERDISYFDEFYASVGLATSTSEGYFRLRFRRDLPKHSGQVYVLILTHFAAAGYRNQSFDKHRLPKSLYQC